MHPPCWSGGGLDQRAHSFTIQTLGFTEIHHIEDDTLKNEKSLLINIILNKTRENALYLLRTDVLD